uniref:S-adenosyl-L-methionine-dependent tRNA 4-demethylwyosine synthase TYW1 n=1 Tax=Romanomermis culicivorax TaxID=13658 RepID=A0A915JCG2_ROMCU
SLTAYKEKVKDEAPSPQNIPVKIYFASQTGRAQKLADLLYLKLSETIESNKISRIDLCNYDPESSGFEKEQCLCLFIVSTYLNGDPPTKCKWFFDWLDDASNDFRLSKSFLDKLYFAVFGLGNSLYEDHFNKVATSLNNSLLRLEAKQILPVVLGDENTTKKETGYDNDFELWTSQITEVIRSGTYESASEIESIQELSDTDENEQDDEEVVEDIKYESSTDEEPFENPNKKMIKRKKEVANGLIDLEDIGGHVKRAKDTKKTSLNEKNEMITPSLREILSKQGYKLIGTHSGVKLCRWTKSMLRGRGGCYKHTFYGIESHRCMEATPSLACANKCVFCWRHHTNPVGTEWKWKMDDPKIIFEGAVSNHLAMIKQLKGVPGVRPERFAEAQKVKHCALSLVGEPIMYPEINKLIDFLHENSVSTFLVTNAQFPDAIRNLQPVTQLYVSVDASTKESLKKIDRPLFKDFWPRFLDSLKALSEKKQRTVYRLTLVKSWNVEEISNYTELIKRGMPDLIEIKGVTYCGESKASTLTMDNVPWHKEVVNFVRQLVEPLDDYEIACEHEHSNCILVANKKFYINGRWHTWIDYEKFHALFDEYKSTGKTFTSLDYMASTPDWAVIGAAEQGFDPDDIRWY